MILTTYPPEVNLPSTNSQVLRDLLDTDGHQLVHVIKHDEAYGTMVTNVTAIEVQRSGDVVRFGGPGVSESSLPHKKKQGKQVSNEKKTSCFRVCRGFTAQLHRDFLMNHYKDPY